jgi:hypothetical protein
MDGLHHSHSSCSNLTGITAYSYPYDAWHDRYQEAYRLSLASALQNTAATLTLVSHSKCPTILKALRGAYESYTLHRLFGRHSALVTHAVERLARHSGAHHKPAAPLVGEYRFHFDGGHTVNMCIDSHDSGAITSPALLEASDIYVKTNYRLGYAYDRRVVPFFNCNPVVYRSDEELRAMRPSSAMMVAF